MDAKGLQNLSNESKGIGASITSLTNGVIKLQMETSTPQGLELLAEFLRDFNKYGINI